MSGKKSGTPMRVACVGRARAALAGRLRRAAAIEVAAGDKLHALAKADLVALAPAEYLALVERAEDAAAEAAYRRAESEERVPIAVVERLLAGESPVRVWREHRGLTLVELGARVGRRKAYLSEIESGRKRGTVPTLRAIAAALAVNLDDIVRPRG